MEPVSRERAVRLRGRIREGDADRDELRDALERVPPGERDAWLDLLLGSGELPDDGPELPRECVPYLPCPAGVLLRVIEEASIDEHDVFVDVGAGIGRVAASVHLLTGARAIGLEIQPRLVSAARELAARLDLSRVRFVEGDATELAPADATVFFLYCPFGGRRVTRWLSAIESIARSRPVRICCVDLTLPPRPWLACVSMRGELAIYRSVP